MKRRRVFYIPGYDPIHPRRYRELYRSESKAQAEVSGYDISIAPRQGETSGWHVEAQMDGTATRAEIEVLVWSDIVRDSMASSIPATYLQLLRTAYIYIFSGVLRRLMWLRKGPVIAALYPVGMLIGQLLIALGIAALAARLVGAIFGQIGRGMLALLGDPGDLDFTIFQWGVTVIKLLVALWLIQYILRWFKAKDGRFFANYLMHDYAFTAKLKGANPPELEERVADFGRAIAHALNCDVDEVLVVGHS